MLRWPYSFLAHWALSVRRYEMKTLLIVFLPATEKPIAVL
jgi:hypothetical protein